MVHCLDYRKNKTNPQIAYIDTECDNQKIIADSFSEYLSQLILDVDDELIISTEKTVKEIVKAIEKTLNIKFEKPDSFAHGYEQYRGQLKESWIWLSPNLVPNGFVRKDENRYDELIELSKGKALRFPEVSSSDLIISFSNKEIEKEVIGKLKENSLRIKPLTELL